MKIGIFTNNYLPNPYGVTVAVERARSAMVERGHRVYLFAPQWKGYTDLVPNIFRFPAIETAFRFRFPIALPFSWKMRKVLQSLEFDIVHAHHPNVLGSVAMRWARKKKVPLVFTWHTLYNWYANFVPLLHPKLVAWIATRTAVTYANRAHRVIVPTESAKEIIVGWGVRESSITVIPTGIDEALFAEARGEKIRQQFGIQPKEPVLFLNCRLTEEKNPEFVFRAVMNILKTKEAHLIVVSDGYLMPKIRTYVQESGVADRVHFAGQVPQNEVKNYYAAADIFVYSSLSETQGLVIAEAMYMRLPVVALDGSGVRDVVRHEDSGFLVSPEQGEEAFALRVQALLGNQELRQQMGVRGRKIVEENLTVAVCIEQTLNLYAEVIEIYRKSR